MDEEEAIEAYFDRRDAALEQINAYKPTSLHEFGEQPTFDEEFDGDLDFERAVHLDCSVRAGNFILFGPESVAITLRILAIRCPEKGCYLGHVFRLPLNNGDRFLAITNKRRGDSRCGFLNWAFSDDAHGMPVYIPATCRCGSVRLNTGWLLEAALLMGGWHEREKHGAMLERLAAEGQTARELLRGARSGIFHPDPAAWRPKQR